MSKLKKDLSYVDKLLKKPIRDKDNLSHYPTTQYPKNFIHQIDILYMPYDEDNKERYALVCIDMTSRMIDAEPLKNKDSSSVVSGIKQIYKRKILNKPNQIDTDAGSEFKGAFHKYLMSNNIKHKVALPNRHSQVALVENANKRIAKPLFKRMLEEEILTGVQSVNWKDDLYEVVKEINKKTLIRMKKKKVKVNDKDNEYTCKGDACNLLDIGTKVRRILDHPINAITKKRTGSKFRETDIRWSPDTSIITNILIKSNQPPLYLIDTNENKNVAYKKYELQVIGENEKMPDKSSIRKIKKTKGKDVYIIDSIVGKRKYKNRIEYMIKWRGFDDSDNTYESRKQLLEDGLKQLINDYEKQIKNITTIR